MKGNWKMRKGEPYPLGTSVYEDKINFSAVMNTKEECGIVLYDKDTKKRVGKIPFSEESRTGNICYGSINGLDAGKYVYRFFIGKQELTDPYAKELIGKEKQYAVFHRDSYDWEGDKPLRIPYEKSIFYLIHVRGFTKHKTSGVKEKGTFQGIIEKIPYLKELGITTLELMPAYEFEECDFLEIQKNTLPTYMTERYKDTEKINMQREKRTNYWGYKKGYYFAPKRAYGATENPIKELKDMIKLLHQNGIEVIMQFYFPAGIKQGFMAEVLKYWILEYHIDGIHVKGEKVPVTLLATDPLFSNIKIMCHEMPLSEIYEEREQPVYKNLAYYRDDFMYDMRKYLKGDDGMVPKVMQYIHRNPDKAAVINFITNYYGFTLMDLVSFEKKHNEINGEENKDGTDYNFSWNCGAEGKSRKKSVNVLRTRQIKNALMLIFLSQGTPLLRAGDELLHSQKGNNNPYCQDNDITWIRWDGNEEILEFTKNLIAFRKNNTLFQRDSEFKMTDYISCGYPDMSYHGEEAWKAETEYHNHHFGVMYCGKYTQRQDCKEEAFVYVAYNLHWQKHRFALPKLPKGLEWQCICSSVEETGSLQAEKGQSSVLEGRTIRIYISKSIIKNKNAGGKI